MSTAPRRRYLLPPGAQRDAERLLGGAQRVRDLGDGLLPGAGQAFRHADAHRAAGGETRLGTGAGGGLLLRGSKGSQGGRVSVRGFLGTDVSSVSSSQLTRTWQAHLPGSKVTQTRK